MSTKTIWSSIRRSTAKAKHIIDSNKWQYFATLTFSDAEIRENYWAVAETMRKMSRQWHRRGITYFYLIGMNNDNAGYHVHVLLHGDIPELSEILPDQKYIYVKTGGKIYMWEALAKQYNVGWHVIQVISCQNDYDCIANYIVRHIADMRLLFSANNVPERSYHSSQKLKVGKSYRYYVGGLKARLYYNHKNCAAVVCQAKNSPFLCALQSFCACTYYVGRYGDKMIRAVADFNHIYNEINEWGRCLYN